MSGPSAAEALGELRRVTLSRSLRGNVRWVVRAVGWGSIVYLVFWSVLLLTAAVQSIGPLEPRWAALVARWSTPVGSASLALALALAAASRVTPVWLDRRDLTHLVASAAAPVPVLTWPAWRAVLPALSWGLLAGGALALLTPRLLGWHAPAALLVMPTLAVTLLSLRWRSALTGGRDALAWGLALTALAASAVATWCASIGVTQCSLSFGAPAAAALGVLAPLPAMAAALGLAVLATLVVRRTVRRSADDLPKTLLLQSEVLAELRAISTLRALAAMSMSAPDPGARFAASRARAALHGRAAAYRPRWSPRLPARGGAISAFAWLGIVRAWRSSPWSLLALPALFVGVPLGLAQPGPFGAAALLPSLALAWAAAQLHPGRAGWPGFAFDARARVLASMAMVASLTLLGSFVADLLRPVLSMVPQGEGWLLLPIGLAAVALVDLIGERAGDPKGLDVWLLAALLVTVPGALLGWLGVEPGVAAPIAGAVWLMVAWMRVLAAPTSA